MARDNIDKQLKTCGWLVQNKKQINLTGADTGTLNSLRGGSWHNNQSDCRSSNCWFTTREFRNDDMGFRFVRIP